MLSLLWRINHTISTMYCCWTSLLGIKGEQRLPSIPTLALRNNHFFASQATLFYFEQPIMDSFFTIFASSVSEETPSQIDFETRGGGSNGYCVIA